jgi:hypothetical protein
VFELKERKTFNGYVTVVRPTIDRGKRSLGDRKLASNKGACTKIIHEKKEATSLFYCRKPNLCHSLEAYIGNVYV